MSIDTVTGTPDAPDPGREPRIKVVNLRKPPATAPGWLANAAASGEYDHLVSPPAVVEGEVVDGEIVDDPGAGKPGTAVALRDRGRVARRQTVHLITTAVKHPRTRSTGKAMLRNAWYPIAGTGLVIKAWRDTHGASRYERMMRQAELAGDQEGIREWEARDVAEKDRRHHRVMDWLASPVAFVKAIAVGIGAFTGLLLVLGIVLAIGTKDAAQVLAPIIGVINLIVFVAWILATYGALMLTLATAGCLAYVWNLGRTRTEPPPWVAPAAEAAGRDVIPDERAITNALRNLNLPAINRKFKEGWAPRWELPPVHDGKGWHSQFLLPEGVTVEMIVNCKAVLAHNLLRLPVEVWPTEPRDRPGMLDLWVADPGSLTKPVAPWPLLKAGKVDFFKGVPIGVDPRGNPVIARPFGTNTGVAGTMGSGKSTLIITYLLGLMLDPLVDIDVYCMAQNADYDPLKPCLRTLFKSDEPDEIPQVLDALKKLMSDLSERGRKLSLAGEPKLTRKLAEADPTMRPRVVVIDECQELFLSPIGEEAAELVEKIVAKARKYGVHMIFATPVPSADSLPRKVAKVLTCRACFAIGDHQGNDAILGTGKHKAGITATTLRPLTVAGDGTVDPGDIGTCMAVGFTPTDGLMRCFYVQRGNGVDEVTPVVARALALRKEAGAAVTATTPAVEVKRLDPLADIAAVLVGHERMRTQEVLAALAALNPSAYSRWTFSDLKDALPESAQPYKTQGVQQVSAHRVAEALADRDNTDDEPDDERDGPDTDMDDEDIEPS